MGDKDAYATTLLDTKLLRLARVDVSKVLKDQLAYLEDQVVDFAKQEGVEVELDDAVVQLTLFVPKKKGV